MHSDVTLQALRSTTKLLGNRLRHFRDHIAKAYNTFETPQEYDKRMRRKPKTTTDLPTSPPQVPGISPDVVEQSSVQSGQATTKNPQDIQLDKQRRTKAFSLQTFKVHALGDYVEAIERFGTTDSYSTQIVSTPASKCP